MMQHNYLISIKKLIVLTLVYIFCSTCFSITGNSKKVLLINSYNYGFPTTKNLLKGINSVFDTCNVKMDVEFLDWKRLPFNENTSSFHSNLQLKLNKVKKYDAIITSDDAALQFALKHQHDLFNEVPIVFTGINNNELALNQNSNDWVTGVAESISMKENIDIMQKLFPDSKKIYCITDNTITGQNDFIEFNSYKKYFPKLTFELIDLKNLTFNELENKLKTIEKHCPVLLISAYKDKTNKTLEFEDSFKIITKNLNAPIFHLYNHGLGEGIIGGKIVSHFELGKSAAKIVHQIFQNVNPKDISVIMKSPNKYIFDFEQLEKYNIKRRNLPKKAIIINKPIGFYEVNKSIIFLIAIIILFQTLLILYLIKSNTKRKKTEKELQKRTIEYKLLNKELVSKNIKITESEKKYKLLFDNLTESFALHEMVFDDNNQPVDYIFREVNPLFLERVNLKYEQVINKSALTVFPNTEKVWIETFGEVAITGKPKFLKSYSKELNRYYEANIFCPKPNFFAALFKDVTNETEIHLKLQKSYKEVKAKEKLFLDMFNSSPVVMIILNEDTEILNINNTGLSLFNKNEMNIIGSQGGDLLSCINAALQPNGCGKSEECTNCILRNSMQKTIDQNISIYKEECEITTIKPNGEFINKNFLISCSLIADSNGKKILVCLEDVSILKFKEKQLLRRNNEIHHLLQGAKKVLITNDFQKTIYDLFNTCIKITGAKSGFVGIRNNVHTEVILIFSDETEKIPTKVISIPKSDWLDKIYNNKKTIIEDNFSSDFLPLNHVEIQNALFSPIIVKDEAVGIIALTNDEKKFNKTDENIIAAFSELAALSFNNYKSNQLIEESEAKFRTSFQISPDSICINTLDQKYININNSFTELFGYTEEDVFNKTPDTIILWVNNNERLQWKYELLENGSVQNMETQFRTKNGSIKSVLISSTIIKVNNKPHSLSIIRDISDLKLQRYYLEKAQEIGNIGSWSFDPREDVYELTGNCYNIFGLKKINTISHSSLHAIIHPKDKEKMNDLWFKCLNGEPYEVEYRVIVKNKIKWIHEKTKIEKIDNYEKPIVLGVVMDVTSRKDWEWQLKQVNKRFEGLEDIITYKAHSIPDLLNHALENVISYTNSDFGAIYHFDSIKNIFYLNNWSDTLELSIDNNLDDTKINCLHKAIETKKPVIINGDDNSYSFLIQDSVDQKSIKSLTIPIIVKNEIVALFWVASKNHTYHDFHAKQVMLLLETTWIIVEKQKLQDIKPENK